RGRAPGNPRSSGSPRSRDSAGAEPPGGAAAHRVRPCPRGGDRTVAVPAASRFPRRAAAGHPSRSLRRLGGGQGSPCRSCLGGRYNAVHMSKIAMPMLAESPASPRDPAPTSRRRPQVLLVTGLSGAGHTTALKILEDIGYEAVDNLPLSL